MKIRSIHRYWWMIILLPVIAFGQSVVINEVMSANSNFLADEDGDFSDWIELYNTAAVPVSLNEWGLSDKSGDLRKWLFPDFILPTQSHLLIFASNKDRPFAVPCWETVIRQGDVWQYQIGSAAVPAQWARPFYSASGWLQGPSGIGYGDGDDATVIPAGISVYGRRVFNIDDPASVLALVLHIDYDDAFVAYLNGSEIARANIGQAGVPPAWNLAASNGDHEARMYGGGAPDRFNIANFQSLLTSGQNLLAIEVHNQSVSSSDLTMIPFLSLGLATIPDHPLGSPAVLGLKPTHFHTNFAVSAGGESLFLTDASGALVDSVTVPSSASDISYGRLGDGGSQWDFFNEPTPETANPVRGFGMTAAAVAFSAPGGFKNEPFMLILSCPTPDAVIRFTTDGSEPDSTSFIYSAGIFVSSPMVVRARAFRDGYNPGPVSTRTFVLLQPAGLPLIALTTDPVNLWDSETGIYVLGGNYQNTNPYYGANFWQDWERPIHVEFYDMDGAAGLDQEAGVQIFGGWSRARPQKGMALFARKSYGRASFDYPLFHELPFTSYHSFILRNSGNDWDRTFCTDALIHSLLDNVDLEKQAYRPCTVFLNGEYWGLLNMREKINEDYLAQHHGVDPDRVDELEMAGSAIEGTADHYLRMMDFVRSHDLSVRANFDYVETQMDIENFLTYQAVEIYIDNRDWPGNNIKFWRPQTDTGRWRWILYDSEWGFGINAYGAGGNRYPWDYNTLAYATSPTQTPNHHGNPPWSTELLRALLQNENFRNRFINRFADLMNSTFRRVRVVSRVDSVQRLIEGEMKRHYEKWRHPVWWVPEYLWWSSLSEWYGYLKTVRDFALYRAPYVQSHLSAKFGHSAWYTLQVSCEPPDGGSICLNNFLDGRGQWSGLYMGGVPIQIAAKPSPGYRFAGWGGGSDSSDPDLQVVLTQPGKLTARFEPEQMQPGRMVINEINYHAAADFNTEDWIELYNAGSQPVELLGWQIRDDDNSHIFNLTGPTINGGQFLVVCRDSSKFRSLFPAKGIAIAGNLSFGLSSSGDQVRLFDQTGLLVDSVKFSNTAPWPSAADGGGPSLELLDPDADNSLAASWAASDGHGTPGEKNSRLTTVGEHPLPLPLQPNLLPNYPNPFNASTTLTFDLPAPSLVRLAIYNLRGSQIRLMVNERMRTGRHAVQWDGMNDQGQPSASGIYFCELRCGEARAVHRILLIR